MYLRRSFSLAVVVVMLLLAGCAKAPVRKVVGTVEPPPSEGGGAKSIRVLLMMGSRVELALRDAFLAEHPDYQVSLATIQFTDPNEYEAKITEKFEEARSGQIDVVSPEVLRNKPPEEIFRQLDPFISQKRFDLKPLEQLLWRYQGTVYWLPVQASPYVLVYNADLFEAAGVPLPRAGWTWDDLREAAVKLTRGSGAGQVWGLTSPQPSYLVMEYLQGQANGDVLQDEKALREALAYVTGLALKDQVMPHDQSHDYAVLPPFARGEAAMTYDSYTWMAAKMPAGARWGVVPLPGRTRPVHAELTYDLGISAKSPNQEAAWTFLSWVAGPGGAKVLAGLGLVPACTGPESRAAWAEQKPAPVPGSHVIFAQGLSYFPRHESIEQSQRFWTMINDSVAGTRNWEEALAEYMSQRR